MARVEGTFEIKEACMASIKADLDAMSKKSGNRFGFTEKQIGDMCAGACLGWGALRDALKQGLLKVEDL